MMTVSHLKKHFYDGHSELLKDILVFVSPTLQPAGETALPSMQSSTETGKVKMLKILKFLTDLPMRRVTVIILILILLTFSSSLLFWPRLVTPGQLL